jgi:hypothetical protein
MGTQGDTPLPSMESDGDAPLPAMGTHGDTPLPSLTSLPYRAQKDSIRSSSNPLAHSFLSNSFVIKNCTYLSYLFLFSLMVSESLGLKIIDVRHGVSKRDEDDRRPPAL